MRDRYDFYRRCWRQQPVLTAIQMAFVLGIGVVGLWRLAADEPPSSLSTLVGLFFLVSFICFVVLVRRDEPDLDV